MKSYKNVLTTKTLSRILSSLTLSAIILCTSYVQSQAEPYTYNPDGCDFEMTFPGEPYTTRRCHPNLPEKCELRTSYTKVFELTSTINFYVSCDTTETDMFDRYDADTMRTILIARAGDKLETTQIGYVDDETAKIASLLGAGKSPTNNNDIMVFIAQLWVGHNSIMTVEGELIGDKQQEADIAFAEILKSIRYAQVEVEEEKEEEEKSSESKPEKKKKKDETVKE